MIVSQHEQLQDPENEADKQNSATTDLNMYTCAFPTVTCQNVSCEKGPVAISSLSLMNSQRDS